MKPLLLCVAFVASGCGADALSYDAVTSIPPGTAHGSDFSGNYIVQRHVVKCDPGCNTTQEGDEYRFCELDLQESDPAVLTETDGQLILTFQGMPGPYTLSGWAADTELPVPMKGGINADGSARVGGAISAVRDQQTMETGPSARALLDGRFEGSVFDGHLVIERSLKAYKGGWIQVNCNAEEDVSMSRLAP